MSKSIELTQSQIKAKKNGATMFIFPIDKDMPTGMIGRSNYSSSFIKKHSPLQKGDKDVWIKEDFFYIDEDIYYLGDFIKEVKENYRTNHKFFEAIDMEQGQSRYSFKEILKVRVVRVQDIEDYEIVKIVKGFDICDIYEEIEEVIRLFYNNKMKEHNINRTYEDNDYIFLVEVKS